MCNDCRKDRIFVENTNREKEHKTNRLKQTRLKELLNERKMDFERIQGYV